MKSNELAQHLKRAPTSPGVYTWRNTAGQPLYIGKALNLKSRLSNYRKPADQRVATMISQTARITWQKTETDIEALLLESQLIKQEKPAFNIMLRGDNNYFYVHISDGDFPKIKISHQPSAIGPFTDGAALKTTLKYLRKLFPYCTCSNQHHLRCLNAHIDKCPGYCCIKTTPTTTQKKEYARNIRAIKYILTGKRATVIRQLARTAPDTALKLLRIFKNAQINSRMQSQISHVPHRIEGYDVAHISGQHAVGAMVVFKNGKSYKNEYRLFNIKTSSGDTDMLHELLKRRLNHKEWPLPDLIVVDGGKAQLNTAKKLAKNIEVIAVTKDKHHRPIRDGKLADSLRDLVVRVDLESHRFAISHYRLRHRKAIAR